MTDARKRAEEALAMDYSASIAIRGVPATIRTYVDALRALLAAEPAKAPFVSRNEEWGLRPDFTTTGVPAPPAGAEVREAAAALRHKMREVYADSRYMNVWATAQERLGPYSGPDWIAESAALDAALAALGLGTDDDGKEKSNG